MEIRGGNYSFRRLSPPPPSKREARFFALLRMTRGAVQSVIASRKAWQSMRLLRCARNDTLTRRSERSEESRNATSLRVRLTACGATCGRFTWGLKSTACAVSTPYGVSATYGCLSWGLFVGLSRAKQGKLCPRSPLGRTMSSLISPLKSIINAFLNGQLVALSN